MITNITLENFKCFRHISINPKLLTVLIGPNGTGKSSVLQGLLLHKQSIGESRGRPIYQGEFIDLLGSAEIDPRFMEQPPGFRVSSNVSDPQNPDSIRQHMEGLRFIPAIRGLIQPTYELGDQIADYISLRQGFDAQEAQLATNLVYRNEETEKLSRMMLKVTGVGLRADPIPGRKVEVKSKTKGGDVNISIEGFGTNALIQLLHQLIIADRGVTVLIEEPEIHLHPKAQADLAEVMAETAKDEGKQIIMTTHSEHLVERLLLLVAEGSLTPDDLAIYSFSKDEKGECSASEIVVTENGQVEGGLTDFYANNLETLDRRVKSLRRPQ